MKFTQVCLIGLFCLALILGGCSKNAGTSDGTGMAIGECSGAGVKGDCIVSYFDTDGSVYLTEQLHSFCGSSKQMIVSSLEPEGKIIWKLSSGRFETISWAEKETENKLMDHNIARVLMSSMLAGSDMLGGEASDAGESVKIGGKWYEPIVISSSKGARQTAYRSILTKRIDMVELIDKSDGSSYISNCFNYKFLKAINKTTPTKLEVTVKKQGKDRIRLLQVEYTQLDAI